MTEGKREHIRIEIEEEGYIRLGKVTREGGKELRGYLNCCLLFLLL
jgi:hypothetical protein